MHQDRITESSNMLHYSNASSIEKSRRYLVIRGACLVAMASRGRQHRSRPGGRRQSRGLPERSNGGGTQ